LSDINHILVIKYSYSLNNEPELEPILTALERRLGGERRPYAGRKGAIDLVTFLELVIGIVTTATLGKVLESYFSGLLRTEEAKLIGQQHRTIIKQCLRNVEKGLQEIVIEIKDWLKLEVVFPHISGKEQLLAIQFQLGRTTCYIVLNQPHITEEALDTLPNAIIRVIRLITEIGIPQDATVVQLYFDPKSGDWRYLLAPTIEGFGHFIDRVIDIRTGQCIIISSADNFIKFADITPDDGFKFLVDPFRYHDKRILKDKS